MKKLLVLLLTAWILFSFLGCVGISSDTSGCGFSQYDSLCTDTAIIDVAETTEAR